MATFDPNDERLTAYILGDDSLSADDRACVAELLAASPDAQRFADELRAAASLVGLELAAEAIPSTPPAESIETAVRAELSKPPRKSWLQRTEWLVAATVLVGFMGVAGYYVATRTEFGFREFARAEATKASVEMHPDSLADNKDGFGSVSIADPWKEVAARAKFNAPAKPEAAQGMPSGGTAAYENLSGRAGTGFGVITGASPVNGPGIFRARAAGGDSKVAAAVPSHGGMPPGQIPPAPSTAAPSRGATGIDAAAIEFKEAEMLVQKSEASPAPPSNEPAARRVMARLAKPEASAAGVQQGLAEGDRGRQPPAPANRPQSHFSLDQPDGEKAGVRPEGLGANPKGATDAYAKTLEERNVTVDTAQKRYSEKAPEVDAMKAGIKPRGDDLTVLALAPKPGEAPAPTPATPALRAGDNSGSPAKPEPGKINLNAVTDEKVLASLADGVQPLQKEAELARQRSWAFHDHEGFNREAYPVLKENDFLGVQQNPLSTFSIDVDTASYSLTRRFLNQNTLPPPGAVRLEELVNYFRYNYSGPTGETPFAAHLEIAECPWNPEHRLARIALKGREIDRNKRPPSNLVFLIDVSGSMDEPNKLPLVKDALKLLVNELGENDRVAIAVYASGSGLVLDSTNGSKKAEIMYAIDNLRPSGSTNGAAGIQCAYDAAVKGFIKGGVNRVLLCTDGDFNVGVTSDDELVKLITEKAKTGVFLSCLAVGDGNLQDKKMMELANKGNGNYGYLDSLKEAQKILVEQMSGTLVTIAKDVKIQVEFNPTKVAAYRLLGYEKRMLKTEDFKDDKKDAGEIGAGHTITAFYELVPAGKTSPAGKTDPLVFQKPAEPAKLDADLAKAMCLVKLRYKQPDGATSTEVKFPGSDEGKKYTQASEDFRFAAAAASFAMILRDSPYKGNATLASVYELASAAKGSDPSGYRAEFLKLVEKAKELKK